MKIDIKKYFYNINHNILINKVKKYIRDKYALNIIEDIINSTNSKYINESIEYLKNSKIKYIESLNISKREKDIKINIIKSVPLYEYNKGLPIGNMTSQILAIFYLNDVDHYIKEVLRFKYYIRYMDDILIIDTNKDKLSKAVSFLGYMFRLDNNKLVIRYNNSTIRRITKNLKNMIRFDKEKYLNSLGSYKGYLDKSNTKFKDIYQFGI